MAQGEVDDLDKSVLFVDNANPRRSTESLGRVTQTHKDLLPMLSVQLPTTQPRACESFYVQYLAFQISRRQGPAVALRGPHGESIVLIEVESSPRFPQAFRLTLLQPSKIDVEHALKVFEGSSVVIVRPPLWNTNGHMTFSVNDPDGVEVQVLWLSGDQSF